MNNLKIPKHIAIMMDGNGRWAQRKLMKLSSVNFLKEIEDMVV
jgi:undecaprenyl diphosphate synthase